MPSRNARANSGSVQLPMPVISSGVRFAVGTWPYAVEAEHGISAAHVTGAPLRILKVIGLEIRAVAAEAIESFDEILAVRDFVALGRRNDGAGPDRASS